jgi:hypothetical protein
MNDQMPTRLPDLALFQQVQSVRPVLHHASALLHVLGVIVGRANRVRIAVRQLRFDPSFGIADLVARGSVSLRSAWNELDCRVASLLAMTKWRRFLQWHILPMDTSLPRKRVPPGDIVSKCTTTFPPQLLFFHHVFLEEGKMVWKAKNVISLKLEFVLFAGQEGANMSALCRRYGIDRKTGRKWLRRYQEEGEPGLQERSRRPLSASKRTAETAQ